MVAGAGALVYWLWKKSKAEANKPKAHEITDGDECIANGYFWGGSGYVAACFESREDAI